VSKYFDETQRAEQWLAQQGSDKRRDILTLLETVRTQNDEPEVVQAEVIASRKIHLSSIVDSVVVGGTDTRHYAMEAYRALRTRLMRLQGTKSVRTVAISSAAPGDGKTATTVNLGLCYAQLQDAPVLLVDGDLRSRKLTQVLGNVEGPGLAEVLSGEARYEDAVLATSNPNLYVLTAGSLMASAPELLAGTLWRDLLVQCSKSFRLILIDTPPVRPLADFELITAACDGFLMVVRAHQTQREDLQQLAGQIDSKKLLGIVLNATETYTKKGYANTYGY
jgi:protein-tyrosine kinase